MVLYVVMGETGEYSDRNEWMVKAYFHEANAIRHKDAAQAFANEYQTKRVRQYSVPKEVNPHDPFMSMDYTGTRYTIWPVDVGDEP